MPRGGYNKLQTGESCARQLYNNYKNRAKKRYYEWEIDFETFKNITKRDCFYCGEKPLQVQYGFELNGVYVYNGIDRIDNDEGYTIENIVACCGDCNRIKTSKSTDEFFKKIKKIVDHCRSHPDLFAPYQFD